jgi:hypothetical protein
MPLEKIIIEKKTKELTEKYPMEAQYSSKCNLWLCALKDGTVSEDQYKAAKNHYGPLWNRIEK